MEIQVDGPEVGVQMVADGVAVVNQDFNLLPDGVIDDPNGVVRDLGNGGLTAGLGAAPQWARLAYVEFVAAESGEPPATELWAVVYEFDDNNQIDFGDFSFFAAAFGQTVGAPTSDPPYVWWADFDKSGRVDFGDLPFFAPNFRKTRSAVQAAERAYRWSAPVGR